MPDEAPETQPDQPTDQPDAPDTPDQQTEDQPESFMPDDFDPNTPVPEGAGPEWLAERYGQMNTHFTKRMMELGEGRRQAEESQALIEGLRNPQTMPHYLRLLGVDLNDPQTLDLLGFELDDDEPGLEDEPELEDRVERLERERAEERQQQEAARAEQALDNLADRELEAIEEQWKRKLTEEEDAFLRFNAENNPRPDGQPDYAKAAKLLKGILGTGVEAELKRREEAGRGGLGGKPGGKALDPTKDEDRLALAAAAAESAMASQQ